MPASTKPARVAVISGAGGGIGRAIAAALHRDGARLALLDLEGAALEETRRELGATETDCLLLACDVTDAGAAARAIAQALAAFGQIDLLVNNAGRYQLNRLADPDAPAVYEQLYRINALAPLYLAHACREALVQSRGSIVNMASTEAFIAGSVSLGYTASKHAVAGLTKALATELAPAGIRVNAVAPGVVETPMVAHLTSQKRHAEKMLGRTPLGRFAQPAEIAAIVLFLASPAASYLTGAILPADGAYMLT
ncbi:SDR family NAD(P)-dependent oxidoreductase [Ferrovibrio sp.]|uniref:SDR family NAD(P)-dependent oxidoreductase n=1 Tax=Ferrovibrio sp. TaxID=1917215 RepID=UPI003D11FE5C